MAKEKKYYYPSSIISSFIKKQESLQDVVSATPVGQPIHVLNGEHILSQSQTLTTDATFIGSKHSGFYINTGDIGLVLESRQTTRFQNLRFRAREAAVAVLLSRTFNGHLIFENCKFERLDALLVAEQENPLLNQPILLLNGKGSVEFRNCEIESIGINSAGLDISFHNCQIGSFKESQSHIYANTLELFNTTLTNIELRSEQVISSTTLTTQGDVIFNSDASIQELILKPLNDSGLFGKKPDYLEDKVAFVAVEECALSIGRLAELKKRTGLYPSEYIRFVLISGHLEIEMLDLMNDWSQLAVDSTVAGEAETFTWSTEW